MSGSPDTITITGAAGRPVAVSAHVPPGATHPAVLICHGFKGFKDWGFFPDLAARLCSAGVAAIRFNCSHNGVGLGEDARDFTRLDLFEQDRMSYRLADVAAVMSALRESRLPGCEGIDPERVGLFGHSLGGAVALIAQQEHPVRCLATLAAVAGSGFDQDRVEALERDGRVLIPNARTGQMMPLGRAALDDWRAHEQRFDLERIAKQLEIPWLIVHGGADPTVPCAAARLHASRTPAGLGRLLVVEDADHVMNVVHPFGGPSPAYEQFTAALTEFFLGSL